MTQTDYPESGVQGTDYQLVRLTHCLVLPSIAPLGPSSEPLLCRPFLYGARSELSSKDLSQDISFYSEACPGGLPPV